MTLTVATNTNTGVANGFTLAALGDELYVPFQTNVFATGVGFSGVVSTSGGTVEVHGAILGYQYGISIGAAGNKANVFIGSDGAVSAYSLAAISITATGAPSGGFTLDNFGQITGNAGAAGIIANGSGQITNTGTIAGGTGISQIDTTAGDVFTLKNTDTGTIVGGYNGSTSTITQTIVNSGSIRGNVIFGSANSNSMVNSGSGSISFGTVTFGNGNGDHLTNFGGTGSIVMGSGSGDYIENFGTINGNVTMGNGSSDEIINAGRINGTVTLGNGGGIFDSTRGTIYSNLAGVYGGSGQIYAGSGGSYIVGALNGGSLLGGVGNDVLIANQTEDSAVSYRAVVHLDGGAGINALYGGGAFNNFHSGQSTYSQIWGGASQMSDVSGYTNNALSYAASNAGVYVDLLNGHDAYVGSTLGGGWTGSGTFEDSIANVPNVTGSLFGDVIQADNGVDRIAGFGRADQLYAGTGASSQDTFVYAGYSDSNTVTGYDTIVGFKLATDKIDLTAFQTDASHLAISTAGTSNTVYLEQTPGTFNAATDLAMIVNTSTAGGLHASNFVF
jgi:hypothetical protein